MIKHSLLFFLFLYLQSCVNSIDTAPFYSEKAVLVGVLEPDSLISIRLTKTFLPTEEFDINRHGINNAEIEVFENDVSLGLMTSRGLGAYSLEANPKPGFKYQVIAHTSLGTLKATDSLLLPSSFTFELSHPNPQNPNSNPDFFVTLSRNEHETGNFWFSMKELKGGVESGSGWFNISSNSPFLDSFNASEDQFYPLKHYGYYFPPFWFFLGTEPRCYSDC